MSITNPSFFVEVCSIFLYLRCKALQRIFPLFSVIHPFIPTTFFVSVAQFYANCKIDFTFFVAFLEVQLCLCFSLSVVNLIHFWYMMNEPHYFIKTSLCRFSARSILISFFFYFLMGPPGFLLLFVLQQYHPAPKLQSFDLMLAQFFSEETVGIGGGLWNSFSFNRCYHFSEIPTNATAGCIIYSSFTVFVRMRFLALCSLFTIRTFVSYSDFDRIQFIKSSRFGICSFVLMLLSFFRERWVYDFSYFYGDHRRWMYAFSKSSSNFLK